MAGDNRSSIMKTTKTLMLAGLAALSLGAGTAMAQETPSMIGPNDYWTQQQRAMYAHQAPASTAVRTQSGSSDVRPAGLGLGSGWIGDNAPHRFDYGTMANPG
jgi:hypothetical protein